MTTHFQFSNYNVAFIMLLTVLLRNRNLIQKL